MMGVLKCVTVITVFDVLYRWLYLDLRINDTFVLLLCVLKTFSYEFVFTLSEVAALCFFNEDRSRPMLQR